MITHSDLSPLRRWLSCDLSPTAAGGLVSHPAFTEAARALSQVKVDAVANPVMAMLSRDAGHYVAAALVLSLHWTSGITLPRLEAAFAETRFMSPGRARSMLRYLLHVGLLSQVSARWGREAASYVPTAHFMEAWCGRMRRGLETTVFVEPAAKHLVDHMDDPSVASAFAQVRGGAIMAGLARATGHDLPFVRIFNHRLGGGRALALLLSLDTGDAPLASASVPFVLDDIVQHCGISRVQARRLFHEAVAEGLVNIGDGRLTWTEVSRHFIAYSCSFEFAGMLVSAATTVNMFPDVFPSQS